MAKLVLHSECPHCVHYNPVAAGRARVSIRCRGCGAIYIASVPTVAARVTQPDAAPLPWAIFAAAAVLFSAGVAVLALMPRKSDAGLPGDDSSTVRYERADDAAAVDAWAPKVPVAASEPAVDGGVEGGVEERWGEDMGAEEDTAQIETAAGTSFAELFDGNIFADAIADDEDVAAAAAQAGLGRAVASEVIFEDAEAADWARDDVPRLPNFDREGLVARLEADGLTMTRQQGLTTFYEDDDWTVEIVGRGAEATLVRARCNSSSPLVYDRAFMANIAATAYSGSDSAGSHTWASKTFGSDSQRVAGRVEMIMRSGPGGASLEIRPTAKR